MVDTDGMRSPSHPLAGPGLLGTRGPASGWEHWDRAIELLAPGGAVVLSGAGLSTESGIPAYRGPDGERRVHPMTAQELLASPDARRRYWARSHVGWPRFAAAAPNAGHRALTGLQRAGVVASVITQNVDGLHQQAGTDRVIDLHGSLARVVCMQCGVRHPRAEMERWLTAANPDFDRNVSGQVRPDGDVDLPDHLVDQFRIVHCPVCASDLLKPDVVMFGEAVPKATVQECFDLVERAGSLLVVGSSLMVMSGYRFVRRAVAAGVPVVVFNTGHTRAGDEEVAARIEAPLGESLVALQQELAPAR